MRVKHIASALLIAAFVAACGNQKATVVEEPSLKDAVGDKFLMGVALNVNQSSGVDTSSIKLVKQHFNSIVAENCMKCEVIHPEEDRYDFTLADQFVSFGEKNGMAVIGHCLIWHSQLAPWFCVDEKGNNVTPEVLKQRMKDHITTIVTRYKGRIKGWDVVNVGRETLCARYFSILALRKRKPSLLEMASMISRCWKQSAPVWPWGMRRMRSKLMPPVRADRWKKMESTIFV